MKRRGFLKLASFIGAAAPVAAVASVDVAQAVAPVRGVRTWTFVKEGALRSGVASDLSEIALEDALIRLMEQERPTTVRNFVLVTPINGLFNAAKLCAELNELQRHAATPITIVAAVDFAMSDCDEWGVVADSGQRFYSPGVS